MRPRSFGLVAVPLLACAVFSVFSAPDLAHGQTYRREAGITFAGDSIANPRGALSLSTNPAGLTDLWGWEARAQLTGGGGFMGGAKGNGIGLFYANGSPLGLVTAFSYEGVTDVVGETQGDDPSVGAHRMSAGGGFRLGDTLRIGWALRLAISEEAQTAAPLFVDLGALYRPWSWISLGVRVRGLAVTTFGEGNALDGFPLTRWGWGVAVRPFAGSDRLTASLDLDWPAGDTLGDVTFSLSSRIMDGVSLMWEVRNSAQNASTGLPRIDDTRNLLMLSLGFGGWGGDLAVGPVKSQITGNQPTIQLGLRMSGDHPHSLRDRGPPAVIFPLKGAFTEHGGGQLFTGMLLKLEELATRPRTRLVVLRAEGLRLTWAQVEELRAAIAHLKKSGKKVVIYTDGLGTRGLMVAAACDKIGMPEHAMVLAQGIGTGFMGLRQALSRFGIAFQTVRFGDYKSAPEQLTRTAISPQLRTTLTRLVSRRWHAVAEAVALGRQMTVTQVDAILRSGVVYPPDAKKAGLIDVVAGPSEFEKQLREWGFVTAGESLERYHRDTVRPNTWGRVQKIALVAVTGTIVGGKSGRGPLGREIGGAQVAKHVRRLTRDKSVKGIAVRIDSPGGGVGGSDIMYKAFRKAAKRKPVFASMASVAASGGYWTAMGADRVFADASTITGSIGIFTLKPSLAGLWRQLGVGLTLLGAGPHPGIMSMHRPWNDAERKVLAKTMRSYYGLFLRRVTKHRGIEQPKLLSLAEGRIWLGDEAAQRSLVDEIGGITATLRSLKSKAKIDPDHPLVVTVWPQLTFRERVMRSFGLAQLVSPPSVLTSPALKPLVQALRPWLDAAHLQSVLGRGAPLALSPLPPSTPQP